MLVGVCEVGLLLILVEDSAQMFGLFLKLVASLSEGRQSSMRSLIELLLNGNRIGVLVGITALLVVPQLTLAQDSEEENLATDSEVQEAAQDDLEETLAGHSYHGEAFNEGPRQEAYLMGGTGDVKFPVSTDNKSCQNFINQGLGQIHGFWDLEAERSFRQAAALDENCAMAYWGCALATVRDPERARGFIDYAKELKDGATDREKMYINALAKFLADKGEKKERATAYLRALEDIVIAYPDDLEAKALVAHRVWENSRAGIPVASYLAVDSLLQDVFDEQPMHPAHHYSIHLWDYRKPERAVRSAALCGPSAPSIAHMWHMPGHIYSRLKRYEDAVYQQEASARVDHAHMMRDQVMPDEIFNFAHNNEWLIRNLAYLGRVHAAIDLAKNMIELPRHPKYNTFDKRGCSTHYGRIRLLQILREYQQYDMAIECCNNVYLQPTDKSDEQVKRLRLLGCSLCMTKQMEAVQDVRDELNELIKSLEARKVELADKLKQLEEQSKEQSDLPPVPDSKKSLLKKTKDEISEVNKEQGESSRNIKSANKALNAIEGYELIANSQFEEAYKKLKKTGGEDVSFLGELQMLAGNTEDGIKTLRDQVKRRKNEVIPMARLVYFLHKTGDLEEARKCFDQLRSFTQSAALDIELFARLTPIAEEFGYGKNWLLPPEQLADVGFRPSLDSLGPFRWSPPTAQNWTLPGLDNTTASNESYAGQPTLVIFYLGHGCLHCAEQLQAFGPRVPDFRDAGIDVIAISTDDLDGLNLSVKNYGGDMPMELVADPELKVFKKFRAYDDFEKQPLHGTFLIDAQGKIRWQDISYEPFMDHEFVLGECQRLLAQDQPKSLSQPQVGPATGATPE